MGWRRDSRDRTRIIIRLVMLHGVDSVFNIRRWWAELRFLLYLSVQVYSTYGAQYGYTTCAPTLDMQHRGLFLSTVIATASSQLSNNIASLGDTRWNINRQQKPLRARPCRLRSRCQAELSHFRTMNGTHWAHLHRILMDLGRRSLDSSGKTGLHSSLINMTRRSNWSPLHLRWNGTLAWHACIYPLVMIYWC